jgi:hypothetical protein
LVKKRSDDDDDDNDAAEVVATVVGEDRKGDSISVDLFVEGGGTGSQAPRLVCRYRPRRGPSSSSCSSSSQSTSDFSRDKKEGTVVATVESRPPVAVALAARSLA